LPALALRREFAQSPATRTTFRLRHLRRSGFRRYPRPQLGVLRSSRLFTLQRNPSCTTLAKLFPDAGAYLLSISWFSGDAENYFLGAPGVMVSSCPASFAQHFAPLLPLRFLNAFSVTLAGRFREPVMQDLVFVICTIVFFAVSILYVRGCERLK